MKIGMLFPGYGSQHIGMAKELYDESRLIQEYFEEASNCLNVNFVKLCFASSDVELSQIPDAYTANFLVSSSIAALLKAEGVEPAVVAGFNFGDYAALSTAGCFSLPDGLYLLQKYATLYQAALPNLSVSMLEIKGVSAETLATLCKKASTQEEIASVALVLLPEECFVGGHSNALDRLRALVHEAYPQASIEQAGLEHSLHSSLMEVVTKDFAMYLEKVDFKDLKMPFISAINGERITEGARIKQYMIEQLLAPVYWPVAIVNLHECDMVVEVGPGSLLSRTVRALYPEKKVYTINTRADIESLKALLSIAAATTELTEEVKEKTDEPEKVNDTN